MAPIGNFAGAERVEGRQILGFWIEESIYVPYRVTAYGYGPKGIHQQAGSQGGEAAGTGTIAKDVSILLDVEVDSNRIDK